MQMCKCKCEGNIFYKFYFPKILFMFSFIEYYKEMYLAFLQDNLLSAHHIMIYQISFVYKEYILI